jgi:hypothetical protein
VRASVIAPPFPLLPTAEQVEGWLQPVAPRWSWDRYARRLSHPLDTFTTFTRFTNPFTPGVPRSGAQLRRRLRAKLGAGR